MTAAKTGKTAHCKHCGATLKEDATCASCIRVGSGSAAEAENAERERRYAQLPKRVPTGGVIMPQ
jgi:hypothetical protein